MAPRKPLPGQLEGEALPATVRRLDAALRLTTQRLQDAQARIRHLEDANAALVRALREYVADADAAAAARATEAVRRA